jgi:hypothetical protein
VETYDRSFALPLPYPSTEVAAVAVRGHLCVLKKSGEARCIKDPLGKDPKLGLSGVEELMVNAEQVPHRFVDMIDTLWGFVAVDDERELWLFNPELKNFGLTKLAAFRKVRDFSQFPCVVSIDGRLRCHDPHVSFGDSTSDGRDVMSDEPLALP